MASNFTDIRTQIGESLFELCKASQYLLQSSFPLVELTAALKSDFEGIDVPEFSKITWIEGEESIARTVLEVSRPELRVVQHRDTEAAGRWDIIVEIPGKNGKLVSRFLFKAVALPEVPSQLRDGLLSLIHSFALQIELLHSAPAAVAAQMLRIAGLLDDGQSRALSHELSGLLHLIAGGDASQVEVTAMQIAGIVEVDGLVAPPRSVRLTQSGARLVSSFGNADSALTTNGSVFPSLEIVAFRADEKPPSVFARLSLLGDAFDVAEGTDDKLCFRPSNTSGTWCWLDSRLSDGWTIVGAEILSRSRDIVEAWGRMHAMKLPDKFHVSQGQRYSLEGQTWVVWNSDEGLKARLSDGDMWAAVSVEAGKSPNEQALTALLQLDPTLKEQLLPAAHEWAERMALSAQVAPLFVAAA